MFFCIEKANKITSKVLTLSFSIFRPQQRIYKLYYHKPFSFSIETGARLFPRKPVQVKTRGLLQVEEK